MERGSVETGEPQCEGGGSLCQDMKVELTVTLFHTLNHPDSPLRGFVIRDVCNTPFDAKRTKRQRDEVRENIALIRIEREEARIEEVDVEGIIGCAERVDLRFLPRGNDSANNSCREIDAALDWLL